ncbi:HsdM family class I SAM-dependent methyltransferase [Pseudomonas asiatica]|uniref:HsdM family class I SAM-dependent methyltransferase n=1 Tax=Pseudomonas asiatica TaxID=2219225 RepID=UPI00345A4890
MIETIPFTSRDALGRYYTESFISSLLVSQMDTSEAKHILDLGSGEGSLGVAASKRWNEAKIVSLDIEKRTQRSSPIDDNSIHYIGDALSFNLPEIIDMVEGSVDLAVSNPPYLRAAWRDEFSKVFDQIGIDRYTCISKNCYTEVVFLAQILRMLRSGGEAGVILPDGIFTAEKFSSLREYLLQEHMVKKVIQLPPNMFKRTEAQTHILIMNKSSASSVQYDLELASLDKSGQLTPSVVICAKDGVSRLDYAYHKGRTVTRSVGVRAKEMQNIATILRGKHSTVEIRNMAHSAIHTTDITQLGDRLVLSGDKSLITLERAGYLIAKPGDILIARVGRDFYKKVARVVSGYAVVSDCIFIIRCSVAIYTRAIETQLCSYEGQAFLSSVSYGVAARQISKRQLSEFPIYI